MNGSDGGITMNNFYMTLYYNTVRQNAKNAKYPNKLVIFNQDDLKKAVSFDHVCAEYKENYRKNDNFIQSDCNMFDVDNTDGDNPDNWITPEDVRKAFPDVPFYISYSRNHMKPKGDKSPRPKFHVYFPDTLITDRLDYKKHKESVCRYFPSFDPNAKDAARFFFGVENPIIAYYEGNTRLYDFMKTVSNNSIDGQAEKAKSYDSNIIPEGQRNTTMYKFASCTLKRYGDDDKRAYQTFINESHRCLPPLEKKELDSIWKAALKFYNETIKTSAEYIPPKLYNLGILDLNFELPIVDYKALLIISTVKKKKRYLSIEICRGFLQTFGIKIRYNDMSHDFEIAEPSTIFNGENRFELLATALEDIMAKLAYKKVRKNLIYDCLEYIAQENRYHPVIELLKENKWDGTDRLPELYQMMGLSNDFHMTLARKWALQTIAILFNSEGEPISSQGILVLQGEQGIGKTELFHHLAIKEKFFKGGAVLDMRNKDTIISSTRVWICELGEIDSTTNKKQSELKAFITERYDRYREPYARKEVVRLRKTSFCGTVNPSTYLTDETGNRRYWTIPVDNMDVKKIINHSPEWYTQFWRQMLCEYNRNSMGYLLSQEEQKAVNSSNEKFETFLKGEDEFMVIFDTSVDQSEWTNKLTAAEIAESLNMRFKSLNISSIYIGQSLLKRIEKRTGKKIVETKHRGRYYKLCPPFAEESFSDNSVKPTLPDYYKTDKYID